MLPWVGALGKPVGHLCLISDWRVMILDIVGGAIPGMVALGSLGNQAKQSMRSRMVNSTRPRHIHSPAPGFYPV